MITHTATHVATHTTKYKYTYICIYIWYHTNTHGHTHTHTHTHAQIHMYRSVSITLDTLHTYTHTHTQLQTHTLTGVCDYKSRCRACKCCLLSVVSTCQSQKSVFSCRGICTCMRVCVHVSSLHTHIHINARVLYVSISLTHIKSIFRLTYIKFSPPHKWNHCQQLQQAKRKDKCIARQMYQKTNVLQVPTW